MGPSKISHHDARQVCTLAAAALCAILLLAPAARGDTTSSHVDRDPTGAPYVPGQLLIAYEPGTSTEAEEAVVRGAGGRTVENVTGEIRLASFPHIKREKSQKIRQRALQRKLKDLGDSPHVEAADYNYIRDASFVPNDPRFGAKVGDPGQWGLRKATFPGAWNDTKGAGATIAIVDSGIDQDHPDLGKILAQHDFVEDDAVADDRNGHGTHVAGIAGALTNNGRGVAGGCPGCKLIVVKVIDANGKATDSDVISGINWSVNKTNDADVVNLSFGSGARSGFLADAINAAYAKGNGAVVVAAAGNEGTATRQYPAACDAAIAVSATNASDRLASFSSHGSWSDLWVDLAAPGTNILSTRLGGGYYELSGTSQAAPFVSALAGLLASEGKTAYGIRQRMQNTATDLGSSGKDPSYGYGRINANAAVP